MTRTSHGRGVRPPGWLAETTALRPGPVPWYDIVRSGLFLPGPMALGLATGHTAEGLFGTLGSLLAVLAERSGSTGQRSARIGGAAFAGVVAMIAGRGTGGTGLLPFLVVIVFACVSGVLSGAHPTSSFAGMQLLVQMSIAGGLDTRLPMPTVLAWYVGGVLFVLVGVAAQGLLEHSGRRHRAVAADAVRALARAVRDGEPGLLSGRTALADAREMIAVAAPPRRDRRRELDRLFGVLTALTEAADIAMAEVWRGAAGREEFAGLLAAFADGLAGGRPFMVPPADGPSGPGDGFGAARTSLAAAARAEPLSRSGQRLTRLTDLARTAVTGVAARGYLIRLTLCMGAAEIVRQADPLPHSYWVLITVAICLKPDFQSVLARTLQRVGGTLMGAVIAAGVLGVAPGWALVALIVLPAALIPYAVRRNYWVFTLLITPIVLVILHFGGPVGVPDVVERVVNTLLGGGVVLVVGYLLWPGTWFPLSPGRAARLLRDLASFLDPATRDLPGVRRRLFADLAALRAVAGHARFEPPAVRRGRRVLADVVDAALDVMAAGVHERCSGQQASAAAGAARVAGLAGAFGRSPRPVHRDGSALGDGTLSAAIDTLTARVAATRRPVPRPAAARALHTDAGEPVRRPAGCSQPCDDDAPHAPAG